MKKKNLMCSLSIILATIALTSCKRPSDCSVTNSSTTSSQTTSTSSSSTHTHSYSKWEVTKKPTLDETGTIERKCTSNDDIQTFTLPKLSETDYKYEVVTKSTCIAEGTGKYTYNKDGQDLELTVELEIDIDNHASLDSNGKCTACYEYQGLHYSFDEANKTCSVIGVGFQTYDEETNTYYSHSPKNVVIPEKITKGANEYSVTKIISSAFASCTTLETVEIPDSVTSIESNAFRKSTSLKSIVIPKNIVSVGSYMFYGCTSLESIVVDKENTTYTSRDSSDKECNAIIKKTDNSLITGCKTTIIPNTVTSISQYAFYGCKSLKTIEIPSSVTIIQARAFSWCTSLESITIPNSVTTIGDDAFDGCTSLKSIVIPSSATRIGSYVFDSCTSLESIVVEESNTTYDSRNNCNAIIKTATNTLLEGCKNTVIPNTVTTIGKNAFYECTSLETIEIPSSVTKIEQKAFYGCTSLKSIEIPSSVTNILNNAFSECPALETIKVDEANGVYTSRDSSDKECNAIINKAKDTLLIGCKTTIIPATITRIGSYAFYYCSSLESINIPSSVTTIDNYAFIGCTALESIDIPSNVTIFEDGVFQQCSSLKSITIPSSVTTIKSNAFYSCTSLESVEIPSSVISIGSYSFEQCSSLKSIVIPSSVTNILNNAFSECTSLESLVVDKANSTYTSRNSSEEECNAIIRKSDNTLIFGCKTTKIPDTITKIGSHAFYNCSSLESINIPSSVTTIDIYAFSRCIALKSIIISKDIATISTTAFYGLAESIDVFVDGSYEDGVSDALTNIFGDRLIYRSNDRPTDITHSYWHYVDGKPVKW